MNETNKKKSCVSLRRSSFNGSVSLIYILIRNTGFYRMAFMRPISAWKFVSKTYKIVRQFFKVRWLPLSMKTVQLARSWWQSRPKTVTMANRGKSFMIYWRVTFLKLFFSFRGILPFAETIEIDFIFRAFRSNGLLFVGCENGWIAYGATVGPWSVAGCHRSHCALRSGKLNESLVLLLSEHSTLNNVVFVGSRTHRWPAWQR